MIQNVDSRSFHHAGPVALVLLACAAVVAPAAHASSASSSVLVPPASLPAEARQPGEAMFLHDTLDGRTLLYIEHAADGVMAVLDVTDPARIKGRGSVPVAAPAREPERVSDAPRVREQMTNPATGTTFLLTDAGLYVLRQPSAEMIRKLRELNYAN